MIHPFRCGVVYLVTMQRGADTLAGGSNPAVLPGGPKPAPVSAPSALSRAPERAQKEAAMRVVFVERDNAPERLVCEAEIVFEAEAGPLAGMKLVGFSLWRSPEGEIYVTFPSRAFGAGSERRFFDFLRSVEGTAADSKRVKAWVLESFKASREAAA